MGDDAVPAHIPREIADVVRAWPLVLDWLERSRKAGRRPLFKMIDGVWRIWSYKCLDCAAPPSDYATCRNSKDAVTIAVQLVCDAHGGAPPS